MSRYSSIICVLVIAAGPAAATPEEEFEKVIRPLLIEKCYDCHSAKKRKGDLRLDSLAAMLEGGESGPALVPGKPEKSLLVLAVRHSEQLKMPPKEKLPAADIAALTEWVQAGAVWPDAKPVTPALGKPAEVRAFTAEEKAFWAFQPVRRPTLETDGRHPIDHFLEQKRKAAGVVAAPAADKRTLIRRVTFDVTGLPPTPEEVEAFENDTSPDAWEKVIDRLLASSAYGEKWGRRWLDVARYADSNGMDENLAHGNAWRYRDYVIRSFNADKPYDQFVKEQIAGDLLPGGSPSERADRLTATGFLVLGPKMLAEDDPMKMRMDIIDEQVDTLGQAFLGLTIGCARCHDHKFDPITQADYYALAGIFYSTKSMQNYGVVARWHERPVGSAESQAKMAEYVKERAVAVEVLTGTEKRLREGVNTRLTRERERAKQYAEAAMHLARRRVVLRQTIADLSSGEVKNAVLVEAENFTRGNAKKLADGYGAGIGVIINNGELPNVAEYDIDVPADGRFVIALRYAAQDARPSKLSAGGNLIRSDAAGEVTGSWNPDGQTWFAEGVLNLTKGETTIRLECAGPFPHFDKIALVPMSKDQTAEAGSTVEELAAEKKLLMPVLRAWAKVAEAWNDKLPAADELARIAAAPNGPFRSSPELDAAVDQDLAAEVQKARDQLAAVERTKPEMEEAMSVEDAEAHDIRIHLRGSHLTLGAEVPRRFPLIVAGEDQAPVTRGSGRLELANWIASPENPLTARVMANRVWLGHFGTGLVLSPNNFGRLGERPTHPELLDYLAAEFVASGWRVKHLHKLILTSEAYRTSTTYDATYFEADPDNRMYWRFNRRRLDAEELRDGMLAVSGILVRTSGGTLLTTNNRAYVNSTGGRGFADYSTPRRTVYLPVIRSGLYDALQANDFPDPSTSAGLRPQTTIPAQALFHLNSSVADETAEAFAKSLLGLNGDDSLRVREAFRRAFTRPPTAVETERVLKFLTASDVSTDEKKLTAWRSLCRVLLSSAEFAFVE